MCEDSVGSWFRTAVSLQSRQEFPRRFPGVLGRAYGTVKTHCWVTGTSSCVSELLVCALVGSTPIPDTVCGEEPSPRHRSACAGRGRLFVAEAALGSPLACSAQF